MFIIRMINNDLSLIYKCGLKRLEYKLTLNADDIRTMKLVLGVTLAILALAHAGVLREADHEYMYIPDDQGVAHLVDLLEKGEDLTGLSSGDEVFTRNVKTITFNLFTRKNPTAGQNLTLNSMTSVRESNFHNNRPTRFITHGWRSSQFSDICVVIRDAYLSKGDYNVIVVDWSSIAGSFYISAAPSVPGVANGVALMINFLSANAGLNLETTKLIGHSLGAHVAGIAARTALGTIDAVIALDPALPLFNNAEPGSRVHRTDAAHVQVIHTNGGFLGIMDAIGDTDFYPNGGSSQPGCGLDLVGSCAHSRSYLYFAESILNPTGFPGTAQRTSVFKALDPNHRVYMGERTFDKDAYGNFHLRTARQAPFALG
ncbi:phospholipase A1 VesT1.02-like [Athalia rosae]|uniref:phospholipase A1 VesT1.02-like n=1 Tax=Athalia rosae TaxID=37344 RepID=UPI0020341A0E|nr:phospholipase A1 VesT1.02-like [Athalia rosae]